MTQPEARVFSDGLSSIFTESIKSTFGRKRPITEQSGFRWEGQLSVGIRLRLLQFLT